MARQIHLFDDWGCSGEVAATGFGGPEFSLAFFGPSFQESWQVKSKSSQVKSSQVNSHAYLIYAQPYLFALSSFLGFGFAVPSLCLTQSLTAHDPLPVSISLNVPNSLLTA